MSLDQARKAEISEIQSPSYQTKRATVPALEEILYEPLKVLDHGFVRTIDYMGDDAAIVQAARVSYGTGTKKISEDQGLINYLMRHRHTTPFEMCEIKYHIKLPIFIARQWIRHRTANVNEYSGRYSIMHDEFYLPAIEHLAPQSKDNRQGRAGDLTLEEKKKILEVLKKDAELCYEHYTEMMNANEKGDILDPTRTGLARELARMNLTLNYYTEWFWKIDLHNLFHFVGLRADDHAQYEIRAYADVLFETVKKWVPYAANAFEEYKMKGINLSAKGREVVQKLITGQAVDQQSSGMSGREWRELLQELQLDEQLLPKKFPAAS